MEDKFEELKNTWQEAKKGQQSVDSADMLQAILKNHNRSKRAHLGNVLVLSIVVVGLCAFFYFLAPLQDVMSRIGIGLMIGGLIIRIIIELVSHRKAKQIDYSVKSSESARQAHEFYDYRKKIHGPITITIIALYTIGFYSLSPEFSRYFTTFWMWMMDGSYVVIGLLLFLGIRRGVVQEMRDLKRISELQKGLEGS